MIFFSQINDIFLLRWISSSSSKNFPCSCSFSTVILLSSLWGVEISEVLDRFKSVSKSALAVAQNSSFLFARLRKYFFNSETCLLYKFSKFWNPLPPFCLGNENLSTTDDVFYIVWMIFLLQKSMLAVEHRMHLLLSLNSFRLTVSSKLILILSDIVLWGLF